MKDISSYFMYSILIFGLWLEEPVKCHTIVVNCSKIPHFCGKKSKYLTSCGGLLFVPHLSLIWGTWGTFIKCPSFWGTFLALWLVNIDHVIKISGLKAGGTRWDRRPRPPTETAALNRDRTRSRPRPSAAAERDRHRRTVQARITK